MKGEHSIRLLCELLGVSRSGFYRWLRQPTSARKRRDTELVPQIAAAHRKGRGAYGAPRIVKELRDQGTPISQRRCARLMREMGLKGKKRHCRKPRTTDSRHGKPVAENLLAKQPAPTGPNQTWVGDITFIKTLEGWVYLAVILDLWSRKVVGWASGATLHASLVLAALFRAIAQRQPPAGLTYHSDRGSQYVDDDYRKVLADHQIAQSMSRAGNCYDNAFAESFFSSFKTESGLEEAIPATRREAELASFDYIESFYNTTRRHSSLGYRSPVAFENQGSIKDIKAA
jgi:transposase InsO family protein